MILYVSIFGMVGDFHALNGHLLTFFLSKLTFLRKKLQELYQSVEQY